jgi:hypothetical protein
MERRNFLKGVAAMFAATAVPPHLNLVAQNLGEDKDVPIVTPPVPKIAEVKRLVEQISPTDIINAAATIPHDPARYGFSYNQLFEIVKLYPGEIPEFPLEFLHPTESNGADMTPSVVMNKDNEMVSSNPGQDYVHLEWADFTSKPATMPKRYTYDMRWDVMSRWIQEMQHSFQAEVARTAWQCILKAAESRNIVVKTDDNWLDGLLRKVSVTKTVMRRNGGGNSSSMRRGMCTDIFVPTQTYKRITDYLSKQKSDELDRQILSQDKFNVFDVGHSPALRVSGVNIKHAPELSWYENKSHFGMAADLSRHDTSIIAVRDDPTMFHKDLGSEIEGFVWQDVGMCVLDPRKLVMVQ